MTSVVNNILMQSPQTSHWFDKDALFSSQIFNQKKAEKNESKWDDERILQSICFSFLSLVELFITELCNVEKGTESELSLARQTF